MDSMSLDIRPCVGGGVTDLEPSPPETRYRTERPELKGKDILPLLLSPSTVQSSQSPIPSGAVGPHTSRFRTTHTHPKHSREKSTRPQTCHLVHSPTLGTTPLVSFQSRTQSRVELGLTDVRVGRTRSEMKKHFPQDSL